MAKYKPKKVHLPVDDEIELPAAVRAASARSEALQRQIYEGGQQEQDTTLGGEHHPGETGSNEAEEKPQETKPQGDEAEASIPQAEQGAEQEPKKASGEDDWEHKFKSLKGRYDQQASTIHNLTSRIADTERLLAQTNNTIVERPASELSFEPLGQDEIETFGEDFIDVTKRAALESVSPEMKRLNDKFGHLEHKAAQTRTEDTYTILDRELPNWREINRNREFIAWAGLPDPYSGVTRIEMLREAFNRGDGPRVLNFFQGFLKDEAASAPALGNKPDFLKAPASKVPLGTFAAPGRAKAPAATEIQAPGEKETITRAQVTNFYRLKSQGHWKGNPEEEASLERRIIEAGREGRIT